MADRNSFYDGNSGDEVVIDNSVAAAALSETNAAASAVAALASEDAAEISENNALASENAAQSSENDAETAQVAAETAQTAAELALDTFDDRYLGAKATDPTLDNDGATLLDGALYFDTTLNVTKVYDLGNTSWVRTTPTTVEQTNINTVSASDTQINLLNTKAVKAELKGAVFTQIFTEALL